MDATCPDEEEGYLVVLEVANEVEVHVGEGRVAVLEVGLVEGQGAGQVEALVVRVVVKAHADLAILEVSGMEEPLVEVQEEDQ